MNERLSRMDRYGQRNRTKPQRSDKAKTSRSRSLAVSEKKAEPLPVQMPGLDELKAEGMDVGKMPTRKELFPSQRLKWTRWFYNSLLYIFVILLIYLLWWGISDSPWGDKYGL
ncbi:hypothetical protein [Paenibacillus sanguinis]|uniref:hypothetical protein n=1 Tax=Paenibacillus sanguinis TaxID=225906 RepID=UPI00036A4610|nr:hypothetical protein [Paenibacillus sanguinis]